MHLGNTSGETKFCIIIFFDVHFTWKYCKLGMINYLQNATASAFPFVLILLTYLGEWCSFRLIFGKWCHLSTTSLTVSVIRHVSGAQSSVQNWASPVLYTNLILFPLFVSSPAFFCILQKCIWDILPKDLGSFMLCNFTVEVKCFRSPIFLWSTFILL